MVEPVTALVALILAVVPRIMSSASMARQNKSKCRHLADRANTLAEVLPNSTYAAANDGATAQVLCKLKAALDEALVIIKSCQTGSIFSRGQRATELDAVNGRINDCINDLKFIRDAARTHHGTVAASAPAQTYDHGSYYYQAQGGASSAYVQGYPATVNPHWIPPPSTAHPAPSSGYSNPSAYFTLPTVNKFIRDAAGTQYGSVPAQNFNYGYVNGYPAPQYQPVNSSPAHSSGYSNLSSYFTLQTVSRFIHHLCR